MALENWQVLAALLAAHFLGDFWLQPDWMYAHKRQAWCLVLHGFVHAALVWLAVGVAGDWWIAPVGVFVTHCLLDGAKARLGAKDVRWFVGDQLGHVSVSVVLACYLPTCGVTPPWPAAGYPGLAVLAGAIATVWGGRYLVGLAVAGLEVGSKDGLPDAGRIIGQLERSLILLLVLVGQPQGIGFLVAAKSVFRFGKKDDERQVSEYVIIGTLWSFGYAVVIAFATAALVARLTESGVLTPGG